MGTQNEKNKEIEKLLSANWNAHVDFHGKNDGLPPLFEFDIADTFRYDIFEHYSNYDTPNGHKLNILEIFSNLGVYYFYNEIDSEQDGNIVILPKDNFLQLVICLENERRYWFSSSEKNSLHFNAFEFNFIYHAKQKPVNVTWNKREGIIFLEINFHFSFIENALGKEHPFVQKIHSLAQKKKPSVVFKENGTINHLIKSIIDDINGTKPQNKLKRLHFNVKISELLYRLLSAKDEQEEMRKTGQRILSAVEIDRMLLARDIIQSRITNPPSLNELSFLVGTNECYLKQHFKVLHGYTVYGYINEMKMMQAKHLLKNSGKKISEIAHILGYKHATHFTSAFIKRFGFKPKEIKA